MMEQKASVFLSALGVVNALGCGKKEIFKQLMSGTRSGIVKRHDLLTDDSPLYVGEVSGDLPEIPDELSSYRSRNSSLLMMAVEEIRDDIENVITRFGRDRVAIIMGSSTSGVSESEKAFHHIQQHQNLPGHFDIRQQELGSVSEFLALYLELQGLAYTISTACSSASHALASGRRILKAGLADAVLAGGVDSLCQLTANGFHALSLLSKTICNPFSRQRDGITLGEGAALFLMQREESEIALLGCGTSSDGYSMTAPDPNGNGVELAINMALKDAECAPDDIDYIHLHGTGTKQNDQVESLVIKRIFGDRLPYSSSKGQIGHTLGTAGAMGAAHCWLAAHHQNESRWLPPHIWDNKSDSELLTDNFVDIGQTYADPKDIFLVNAFAFGGNNVSLILGRNS